MRSCLRSASLRLLGHSNGHGRCVTSFGSSDVSANGLAEAPLIVAASHDTKTKYLGRMTEEPLMAAYCVVSQLRMLMHIRTDGRRQSQVQVQMWLASRREPRRRTTSGF